MNFDDPILSLMDKAAQKASNDSKCWPVFRKGATRQFNLDRLRDFVFDRLVLDFYNEILTEPVDLRS